MKTAWWPAAGLVYQRVVFEAKAPYQLWLCSRAGPRMGIVDGSESGPSKMLAWESFGTRMPARALTHSKRQH